MAFLALRDRRLPRTLVAGTLWLENSQERAFGNLRSALWRLRQQIESVVDADTISLRIASDVEIDVRESAETAARLCNGLGDYTNQDCTLEPFLDELLPGWYDDWVLMERESIRQQSLHALEAIASALVGFGHHGAAVQAALHAIRLDPLRESAHRCLIMIHLDEGNQSEAMRQFRAYESMLAKELGLIPSQRMIDLIS